MGSAPLPPPTYCALLAPRHPAGVVGYRTTPVRPCMILGGGSEPTDLRGPKDFAVEQKQGSPRRGIRCWPLERFDTETKTLWVASGPEVLQLDSLGKTIGNFELFLLEGGPPLQAEGPLVDRDFIRAARPLRGTFEFMKPHGLTICKSTDHQQVKPQDTSGENIARFDLPNAPGAEYFFRLWLMRMASGKWGPNRFSIETMTS